MSGISFITLEDDFYYLKSQDNSKFLVPANYFYIFYNTVIRQLETNQNLEEVKAGVKKAYAESIKIGPSFKEKLINFLFYKTVVQRKELVERLERSSSFSIEEFEANESIILLDTPLPFRDHALFKTEEFLTLLGKGYLVKKRNCPGDAHTPPTKKICRGSDRKITFSIGEIEAVLSGTFPIEITDAGPVDEKTLIPNFVNYCYIKRYSFIQKDILNRFRVLIAALSNLGFTFSSSSKETKLTAAMNKKKKEVIEQEIQQHHPHLSSIAPSIVRKRDTKAEDFLQRLIQDEVSRKSMKRFSAKAILEILKGDRIAPFFTTYRLDLIEKRREETYGTSD